MSDIEYLVPSTSSLGEQVPSTWYQVLGNMYLVSVQKYQVSGARRQGYATSYLAFRARCEEFDTMNSLSGIWYQVLGTWLPVPLALGTWLPVLLACYSGCDTWYLVPGSQMQVRGLGYEARGSNEC